MPIKVKFDVFSGETNPQWEMTPAEFQQFLKLIPETVSPGSPERAGSLVAVQSPINHDFPGYRGFEIITTDEPPLPDQVDRNLLLESKRIIVGFGVIDFDKPGEIIDDSKAWFSDAQRWQKDDRSTRANIWEPARKLESWLLDKTIEKMKQSQLGEDASIHPSVFQLFAQIASEFEQGITLTEFAKLVRNSNYVWVGPIAEYWNSDTCIRETNRCYNFATNVRFDCGVPRAIPGTGAGIETDNRAAGMRADGLECLGKESPKKASATSGGHNVALVLTEPHSPIFHCYRQLSTGKWAHKPGQGRATNRYNEKEINDPHLLKDKYYKHFAGYFFCPEDVTIGPSNQEKDEHD